jgi:hypothetical protein
VARFDYQIVEEEICWIRVELGALHAARHSITDG